MGNTVRRFEMFRQIPKQRMELERLREARRQAEASLSVIREQAKQVEQKNQQKLQEAVDELHKLQRAIKPLKEKPNHDNNQPKH